MARTPYSLNSYTGAAPIALLASGVTNASTTIVLSNTSTGWTGLGVTGGFNLALDYGTNSEEKIFVPSGSLSWDTSTVTLSGITRGIDGTSAVAHNGQTTVAFVSTAIDFSEANLLVSQTLRTSSTTSGGVYLSTVSGLQNFSLTPGAVVFGSTSGSWTDTSSNNGTLALGTTVLNSGIYANAIYSGGLFQNNQVTVNSGNIALLSGYLSTVSGVAYALSNTQQAPSVPANAFLVSGTASQTYKAWTQDPVLATTTVTLITGTAFYQAIWIPQKTTISGFSVSTSGGATTQTIFAGLFNTSIQLATFSGITNTAAATPTMRYSSISGGTYTASPGLYYIGIVVSGTGTTSISFVSLPSGNISLINLNIPGPTNSLSGTRSSQVVIGQRQFYAPNTAVSGILTTTSALYWSGLF